MLCLMVHGLVYSLNKHMLLLQTSIYPLSPTFVKMNFLFQIATKYQNPCLPLNCKFMMSLNYSERKTIISCLIMKVSIKVQSLFNNAKIVHLYIWSQTSKANTLQIVQYTYLHMLIFNKYPCLKKKRKKESDKKLKKLCSGTIIAKCGNTNVCLTWQHGRKSDDR